MAAADAGGPRRRRAPLPGVDGARPGPPHGRRAPLGHRLSSPSGGPSPRGPSWTKSSAPGRRTPTWPAGSRQGCADLVAALAAAPDDLECWTFLPAPSPRAMWARRQAHETAIHRVDAELAAGLRSRRAHPSSRPTASTSCCRCSSPVAAPRCAPTHRSPWRCVAPTSTPPGCCAWRRRRHHGSGIRGGPTQRAADCAVTGRGG